MLSVSWEWLCGRTHSRASTSCTTPQHTRTVSGLRGRLSAVGSRRRRRRTRSSAREHKGQEQGGEDIGLRVGRGYRPTRRARISAYA
eukprot:3043930-Rhodomonas_salina.2